MGVYRPTSNITTNSPSELALLNDFGDILTAGGTDVIIVPEIHRIKFRKNAINCWMNPITGLTRISLQGIFRKPTDMDEATSTPKQETEQTESQSATSSLPSSFPMVAEYTIPCLYDILKELTALGQVLFPPSAENPDQPGIDPLLPIHALKSVADVASKPTSNEKPSMLVDVEKGRPTELEVVLGEVVRSGRKAGVPMPVSSPLQFAKISF